MRVGMFGRQLYRTTILIEGEDQYKIFNKTFEYAFKDVKHVEIEVYKHDLVDFYVVSLAHPLGGKGHNKMMRGLQVQGYNLRQLSNGGLHLMFKE